LATPKTLAERAVIQSKGKKVSDPSSTVEAPLWGKVTSLALQNSPALGLRLYQLPDFIKAFAEVKLAAARTNCRLGLLDTTRTTAISRAAIEVAEGGLLEQFQLRVVATGGGTSTNMNVNRHSMLPRPCEAWQAASTGWPNGTQAWSGWDEPAGRTLSWCPCPKYTGHKPL
jgi:hypothetical protein